MKKRIVLSVCAAFALMFMAVDGPVACGIGTSPSEARVPRSGAMYPAASAAAALGVRREPLAQSSTAPDASTTDGIGTSPSFADPDKDPGSYASSLLTSAKDGKWRIFAGLLLVGVVWAARKWGSRVWPWLKTDRGGAALVLALGLLGGLATALVEGASLNVDLLVNSLSMATGGAGIYAVLKKLISPGERTVG